MRTVTPSDHTAAQMSAAAAVRDAEHQVAVDAHRQALTAHEANLQSLRVAVRTAWQRRKPFSALVAFFRLWIARKSEQPRPPVKRGAGRDEIVLASGRKGEQKVAAHLGQLSDEWALVSGYRNAKGEIDQVLIGPRGVFAIEIKFINGVVYCNGDRWWSDKYDRYGNMVETGRPIADKRGRGPSKQLNDAADLLQGFLAKRCDVSRVHRVVVLSHESSGLGNLKNITVDAVATIDSFDLERLFARSSIRLDTHAVDRILKAIQKDHEFHARSRAGRQR